MSENPWWPSPYGPDDQIGKLNEVTPAKVLQAADLVRQGRVIDLGHILHEQVPAFPGRTFRQHLDASAHWLNRRRLDAGSQGWGENNVNWVIEQVSATSQMGTHLDALNHLQIGDRFYNGHRLEEIAEAYGTNQLGVETIPQVITRGLLLNVAALHQVHRLPEGYAITRADARACLDQAGLALNPGDAVLFHTGWGELWMQDNERYLSGEPGPGMELAEYLAQSGVAITGCDTWSYGPVPPENPRRPFEVPQTLNVRHGLFIIENLKTRDLAGLADPAVAFMFVLTHARVQGATGVWVSPVAVL